MTPANDNLSVGAVYEIEFQLECMRRGHTVSVPICDNAGYDAIVDGRKGLTRIQVRGTTVFQTSRYQVGTGIGKNKVNTKGDYDYLAVRIPNHDAWYLVPQDKLLHSATAKFYPHNSKSLVNVISCCSETLKVQVAPIVQDLLEVFQFLLKGM